jgi:pimeloyl-ACP methyl ester carboxylesterase
MRKLLAGLLLIGFALNNQVSAQQTGRAEAGAQAQQIPLLSDLFARFEEFNRLYAEKRKAGANLSAVEPLRKRGEEAFRRGHIPGILEVLGEAQALLTAKKWDDRQRFISSLTLEVDRLVVEPNQVLQVSLTRMFQVNIDKAFTSAPTVTLTVVAGERAARSREAPAATQPIQATIIAQSLPVAEAISNASRRLLLPDGAYEVVASVEAGGQKLAEIKRSIYAIGNFTDSVAQMSKTVAALKNSPDAKIKALAATPEFQLQRLAQSNKSRGEVDLNPNEEIDRIETELAALAKGQDPFANARGELERAYQAPDGKLLPYRIYVPKSYDGAAAKPLVVLLHGALGDERYYFSGLFDPAVIKGEAERRGYILVGVNGRGRFANYSGAALDDVFAVTDAMTRDYKIDPSRVYLAGHSTGGFGVWLAASSKPEKFAAVAAVSGGPPVQGDALTLLLKPLKGLPALIAHGAQDGIVPALLSKTMAAAAEKAGLKVNYFEVPDGDHMSVVASTFPAIMDFFDKNSKPDVK